MVQPTVTTVTVTTKLIVLFEMIVLRKLLSSLILFPILVFMYASQGLCINWSHELALSPYFSIKWDAQDPAFLTMEISALAEGYVALGFSSQSSAPHIDMVVAWVDFQGVPHIRVNCFFPILNVLMLYN